MDYGSSILARRPLANRDGEMQWQSVARSMVLPSGPHKYQFPLSLGQ
jgi:hypothetical protein